MKREKKVCIICGKEFATKNKNQKYCSRACYYKTERKVKEKEKKVCPVCGKEFIPKNNTQKYCSSECYKNFIRKEKRVCPVCGKEFTPTNKAQKYCSRACYCKVGNNKQKKETRCIKPEKVCIDCGKSFLPLHRMDRYYCPECAKKRKKDNMRIRVCQICENEFLGGPRAKYCPSCAREQRKVYDRNYKQKLKKNPVREIKEKTCAFCGKEYLPHHQRQKYCSPECSRQGVLEWQRNQKKNYADYVRQKLGDEKAEIIKKGNKKSYASFSGQDAKKAKKRKNPPKVVCVYCGMEFTRKTREISCSEYCKKKHARIIESKSALARGRITQNSYEKLLKERDEYREKQKQKVPFNERHS